MNTTRNLMMITLCASLAFAGCTSSNATEEPHIEKIHLLLQQGEKDGYPEASRYLQRLDEQTQSALARRMLRDENPAVAYLGGSLLVRQKRYDEAASVMAALILNGRNEHVLRNRMEFDWRHDTNPATWPNMMSRVGRILIVSRESAPPESRKRAEHFLIDMLDLEVNKNFTPEDAVSAIMKLKRELKQGIS